MINMKLLEVVTPPSIYHGCSTWKTFWEERFTGEGKLFSAVNMKNCGRWNVSKNREIKGSDKYVTLDIWFNFDSLDNMKMKSSESKEKLEKSGKGFITSLGFKSKVWPHKYKKLSMPSEMSVRRNFWRLLRSLKITLWKLWEEEAQTWAYWQLLLPSKTDSEVYDERVCPQRRNVRKHREIKGSDKYVTLNTSLKFDSLDKMRITSPE